MKNLALMWVLAGVAVALLAAGDGKPPVSTFTDKRDGKVYKIVKIGNQTWFAENLNYATECSYCYEDSANSCAKYGRLYTWEAALKACPAGTHLPTNKEWTILPDGLASSSIVGIVDPNGSWWSATEDNTYAAWVWGMNFNDGLVKRGLDLKSFCFSVRCVVDDEKERRK